MVQKGNKTTLKNRKIMKAAYYLKLLLGTLILTSLYFIYDYIFTAGTTFNAVSTLWGMVSNFLVVAVLSFYVTHSNLGGFKLIFSVFAIFYIIGSFNLQIEAYIFNVTDRAETINLMLQGLFITAFFSPIFIYIFNKWGEQTTSLIFINRSVVGWVWRVLLGVFLYLIFYITAGMVLQAAYPGLMDFYKDKLPTIDTMLLTQFPRGFLFVFISILILCTSKLKLTKKTILIGLVFSILGGIAPLIPPSEFMPGNIRLVHGIEVGVSNFLYGLALGFLLGQKIKNEKLSSSNEQVILEQT